MFLIRKYSIPEGHILYLDRFLVVKILSVNIVCLVGDGVADVVDHEAAQHGLHRAGLTILQTIKTILSNNQNYLIKQSKLSYHLIR